MTTLRPLVGLPADTREDGGHVFHQVGDKYLRAVAEVADCLPIMIPALADAFELDHLLDHLDGVLLTGAVSNVHPPRYGTTPSTDHEPYDLRRDDLTFTLVARCLARGIPLFCICRGFQELNVALGGTLETELQRGAGRLDHRVREHPDVAVRYGPSHEVDVVPGGWLHGVVGKSRLAVNSLHRQGIATLAPSLVVEAQAPDSIIEAVTVGNAAGFAFGAQWHPEFAARDNPDSVKLFQAFGNAMRAHRISRNA